MNQSLLLGGPGTGKTTKLIQKIQEIKPNNFAFLSFTRQAANEAKSRLSSLYSVKELDNVRTIHSLAFKVLGLSKNQVFSWVHQKDFGNEYGFDFTYPRNKYEEDDTYEGLTDDDVTWRQMNRYIVMGIETNNDDSYDYDRIEYMYKRYKKYKDQKLLFDFNDMLVGAQLPGEKLPKNDLLCIDETQDLSPLQFAVIDKLAANSNQVIYAGDDDQMIYEWAGVKREYFTKIYSDCILLRTCEVLTDNWRSPPEILEVGKKIILRCRAGIKKEYKAKILNPLVSIKKLSDIDQVQFNPNLSYLILVRNSYLLTRVKFLLDELNIKWSYLQYKNNHCNIHLSTIHGAKGAEADVVILLTDVSPATYENITKDSEHRVWYVGVTRAKKQLIIIEPQSELYYEL